MDTLIFLLIVATLVAIVRGMERRWVVGLFLASVVAATALFSYHVTDPLGFYY